MENNSAVNTTASESNSASKKNKFKKIIFIAVALIIAVGVISLFGGNKSEKAVKEYISEFYNDDVKKIKEEWNEKYEVDLGYGNWVDAEASLYQVEGEDFYYICTVTVAGDYVDVEADVFSEKPDFKDGLKDAKKIAKQALKEGKREGIIR